FLPPLDLGPTITWLMHKRQLLRLSSSTFSMYLGFFYIIPHAHDMKVIAAGTRVRRGNNILIVINVRRRCIFGLDLVDPVDMVLDMALTHVCCFGYASAPGYKYFISNNYARGHIYLRSNGFFYLRSHAGSDC
ncbi:MAG: hypothetical protein MPEBLZ_04450, partial [Candidatus Methanoperedens nitroreducens]